MFSLLILTTSSENLEHQYKDKMPSIISSPVRTTDSSPRNFGKFVSDQPAAEVSTSPPAASPASEPDEGHAAPSQSSSPDDKGKPADTTTAATRAKQFLKCEHDRRARVESIVRLNAHKQIERLVDEIEHLRRRIAMQDKALTRLHIQGLQKDNLAATDKKDVDDRLWSMENKFRRDSVAETGDIKRRILDMVSFDSSMDVRTSKLKTKVKEQAVACHRQRDDMLHMKSTMEGIEKAIEEVKGRMGHVMAILEGAGEEARSSPHAQDDGGVEPSGREMQCPGKRMMGACPQLECCPEDESPAKKRRGPQAEGTCTAPHFR